jgi:hypothetical protein
MRSVVSALGARVPQVGDETWQPLLEVKYDEGAGSIHIEVRAQRTRFYRTAVVLGLPFPLVAL